MARRRFGGGEQLNAWPGYVDALSTLLMVIIFVLLVFVLAQAFLSVALTGRDRALDRVNRQMAELTDMLSLERGRTKDLQLSIAQLNDELRASVGARDALTAQLDAARKAQSGAESERDSLKVQRDQLTARLADDDAQVGAARSRADSLQAQISGIASAADQSGQASAEKLAAATKSALLATAQLALNQREIATRQRQLDDAARALAEARQQVANMQKQAEDTDRTVQADKATIAARLSDLAKLGQQVQALTALRDDLERQARDAAAKATTEEQRAAATSAALADEKKFSDSARAQIALLQQQIEQLRAQLASVGKALDASETSGKDKDAQIANLGSRLNAALARKVEELQRYRSDFFGKLREVLANRPGVQVVGDRFVFQSEVLFPVGSAELTPAGQEQISALATTLKQIAAEIPPDVNWLLRVDGHADRQQVANNRFRSNWELSSERAITVVKLLIADGIPADRVAATGFSDNQPLDPADTPEAYAKNRRIEIRLTDR